MSRTGHAADLAGIQKVCINGNRVDDWQLCHHRLYYRLLLSVVVW